jgi:amino acid transporter
MARDSEDRSTTGATSVGASANTADDRPVLRNQDDADRHDRNHVDDGLGREFQARRREADARAHDRFGGIKWGAAFFGWLSANGLNVILLALATAAGAAVGITQSTTSEAKSNADTIGIVGGIVLLVILAIGYYAGGYVAGRMSRFDGARQGVAVWVIGLIVTILLAAAGAIFGGKYNVLSQLNLPRIPVDEGSATTGGVIALVLVLLATLGAAVLGGKAGERYHRKVDRAGSSY